MTRDDLLGDLLVEWEEAKAAGRPVTPQHLCRACPELLDPFTRLLRELGHIESVFDRPPATPDELVGQIDAGRFAPVAFHAAGGLGLVFLAEDRELNRPVALKWMQQLAALDPAARRRFLMEAEITGKLEHPGIAPVYGAGVDPHGRPYYAMRFIQGDTLADAARDHHRSKGDPAARQVEFARLLRAFAAVCQTVAYAHARGVLHRDIKPGNVLLGEFGETMLVDWGLAKPFEPADPAAGGADGFEPVELEPAAGETVAAAQTQSGRAKGTPAFMAPEQARGEWERVGPAADVYALGATLYVLLTGQPPYSGKTAEAVIAAVKKGPPRPVRKVNRSAPKPLAAVCAKAMARDPAGRYATALELAGEVERWLADEPVTAFRDPLPTRCRRWVKRNRVLASAGAAAVLVLTAALAVIAPILTAKNSELKQANEKLSASYAAEQTEYDEADAALVDVMGGVFARAGAGGDEFTMKLRNGALVRYRDHLKGVITRNESRPERRMQVASSWQKVGEVEALLGRLPEALDAFAEAEAGFTTLKAERPEDREVLWGWACALHSRGELLSKRGRLTEGEAMLTQARAVFVRLAADPAPIRLAGISPAPAELFEDSPALRVAKVDLVLADVQRQARQVARAATPAGGTGGDDPAFREQLKATLRTLAGGKPLPADAPLVTQLTVFGLRVVLAGMEPDAEAKKKEYLALLAEVAPLAGKHPDLAEYRGLIADVEFALAQLDLAESEQLGSKVEELIKAKKFVEAKPLADAADAKFEQALQRLDRASAAAAVLEKADLGMDVFDVRGTALALQTEIGLQLVELASVQNKAEVLAASVKTTVAALKRLSELKPLPPEAALRGILVVTRFGQALALTREFRPEAEAAYTAGLALCDRLMKDAPEEAVLVQMKAILLAAVASMKVGQKKSGAEEVAAAEKLLATLPPDPTDWGQPLCRALILNAKAGEAFVDGRNFDRVLELYEEMGKVLNEAEKAGMPAADIGGFRLMIETQVAVATGLQAMDLLEGPKKDVDKARPLLARARTLLLDLEKRVEAEGTPPQVAAFFKRQAEQRKEFLAALDKLDALANPKK